MLNNNLSLQSKYIYFIRATFSGSFLIKGGDFCTSPRLFGTKV